MQYKKYTNTSLQKPTPTRRSMKKRLFLLVVILLAVGGVLAALELTDTTYIFHKKPAPQVTGGPGTKGVTATDESNGSDNSSDGTDNDSVPPSEDNTDKNKNNSTKLKDIQALFVSAHNVPLNAPINSTCSTTSGATCQIIFTKDGVTKTLPVQLTDRGGSTYWNGWKPKDIGLTPGEWNISAKATLGSQTKTAADALPLKVKE